MSTIFLKLNPWNNFPKSYYDLFLEHLIMMHLGKMMDVLANIYHACINVCNISTIDIRHSAMHVFTFNVTFIFFDRIWISWGHIGFIGYATCINNTLKILPSTMPF